MAIQGRPQNKVAELFPDKQDREQMALELCRQVELDLESRSEWSALAEEAMMLHLQKTNRRPAMRGGANICHHQLSAANLQFQGRAYSAMFEQPWPERVRVVPQRRSEMRRAKNAERLLNWQVIVEIEEYEEEWDRLLGAIPIRGTEFTKAWWDWQLDRPCFAHVSSEDLIVPHNIRNLESAPRITHRRKLSLAEIFALERDGYFENTDELVKVQEDPEDTGRGDRVAAKAVGDEGVVDAELSELTLYEIYCDILMENPGTPPEQEPKQTPKPVTITVAMEKAEILRVEERERTIDGETFVEQPFTDYHFIPNPSGFYSFGYSTFLAGLTKTINSVYNQYIDAGRLSNMPFGFLGRGSGLRNRKVELYAGKFIDVDDTQQVQLAKLPGVDPNLPTIIKMLEEGGNEITSNSSELKGESSVSRDPTVRGTLARIEQGLVSFGVITKRIARQQSKELRRILTLDQMYMNEDKVFHVLGSMDAEGFVALRKTDIGGKFSFIPTADPAFAAPQQRRAEAAQAMEIMLQVPGVAPQQGSPGNPELLNQLMKRFLTTFDMPEVVAYLPESPEPPIPLDEENYLLSNGREVAPKQGEPHAEHLKAHLEQYEAKPSDQLALHIEDTRRLAAQESQIAQMSITQMPEENSNGIQDPGAGGVGGMAGPPSDQAPVGELLNGQR